jgi:hypothetical protein
VRFTKFAGLQNPIGERGTWPTPSDVTRFVRAPRTHTGPKATLPLWSPATFRDNQRNLAHVLKVKALVFDIDEPRATIADLAEPLGAATPTIGWWLHSSFSSEPGALKFRAFCELSEAVAQAEHVELYAMVGRLLRRAGINIDGACKDASRAFFVPAKRPGGIYEWAHLEGSVAPVFALLNARRAYQAQQDELQAELARATRCASFAGDANANAMRRASAYVERVPGAVSGQGGHRHTFSLAVKLVKGFGLTSEQALALMSDWNRRCQPPWSQRDLERKIIQAAASRLPENFMHSTRNDS